MQYMQNYGTQNIFNTCIIEFVLGLKISFYKRYGDQSERV